MTDAQFNRMDTPRAPDQDAIAIFDAVKHDVIKKLQDLRHDDIVHHTHETDDIARIKAYKLVLFAREEVGYGWNYFGKIQVAEGKYVHARAHKYHQHDKPIDFYNIDTGGLGSTRDAKAGSIRTLEDPLVYFNS
ncbi:hypothetical protein G9A89_013394 [Geosiphon pyriformis]|nr:hypothetical protein G9A89_013394 [Geosiphon pyriformis]